jgi:glutamate/tyrosine decarboxylase-like PLP-dependent enzyme
MKHGPFEAADSTLLARIAKYAEKYADNVAARDAEASSVELRKLFDVGLPATGRTSDQVLQSLIDAAEPGLVGSTAEGFLSWVVGGSHPAGVAADWLASAWGQNAAIYQTSPAAAACEEVVGRWLIDMLELPEASAVGFVTGATMATFTCLAAARGEVMRRAGYDFDRDGLQGGPRINVILCEDIHVTNRAALRYLGFGEPNLILVEANESGVMDIDALRSAAAWTVGPTIILAQAGHINSGAFDDFAAIAEVASELDAWVHVDGAFGLWARSAPSVRHLATGCELADSWAVDGHKWLQTPYDSGFAIVRDETALRRAMAKSAGYLNRSDDDGRDPAAYVPELSRRARGFSAWVMLQVLGRDGIAALVEQHCEAAAHFARACVSIPGATVLNDVVLNQVAVSFGPETQAICDRVNATGRFFIRTAQWRGTTIMRLSFCGYASTEQTAGHLADAVAEAAATVAHQPILVL